MSDRTANSRFRRPLRPYSRLRLMRSGDMVGGPTFDPVSALFGAAENGVFFNFMDRSALFQTNDTSTPVTGAGQSIGYAADLSGNTKHVTQATVAVRPTSLTDGDGRAYANFDGGDRLTRLTPAIGLVDMSVWILASQSVTSASQRFVSLGANNNDFNGASVISFSTGDASNFLNVAGGATTTLSLNAPGVGASPLSIYEFHKTETTSELLVNGTQVATDNAFTVFSALSTGDLGIGARVGGTDSLSGDIYAIIIRCATTDSTTRAQVRDWLRQQSGKALA